MTIDSGNHNVLLIINIADACFARDRHFICRFVYLCKCYISNYGFKMSNLLQRLNYPNWDNLGNE